MTYPAKPNSAYDRTPEQHREHSEILLSLLPLISKIVAHRLGRSPLANLQEDVEQFCALEVWKALPRWEPERGLKVGTWITPRIIGAIADFLRGNYVLKGGRRNKRTEVIQSFSQPTMQSRDDSGNPRDWDPPDGKIAAADFKAVDDRELVEKILRDNCNEKSRLMLRMYFLENMTMKEVSEKMGFSESRMSQMMKPLIARLADVVGCREVAVEVKAEKTKVKRKRRVLRQSVMMAGKK